MKFNFNRKNRIFSIFILVIIFLILPFTYSSDHLDPLVITRLLCLTVINALLFIHFLLNKKRLVLKNTPLPQLLIVGSYILFLLFSGLSLIASRNLSEGFFEIVRLIQYSIFLILLTKFFQQKGILEISLKIIQLLGLSLILVSLFQLSRLDELPLENVKEYFFFSRYGTVTVEAFMGNPNLFSFLLLLILPFSVLNFLINKNNVWRILTTINIVSFIYFLLYSKTDSVFVILPLTIGFTLILFANSRGWINKQRLMGLIVLFSICFFSSKNFYFDSIKKEIINFINFETKNEIYKINEQTSIFERTLLLKNSFEIIKDNYVFGAGLGDWKIEFQKYGVGGCLDINYGTKRYQRPHNDYIQIFCDSGIFSLLFFVLFLIFSLYYSSKLIFSNNAKIQIIGVCLFSGIMMFSFISVFSYPKERPFINVLFLTYVAVLNSKLSYLNYKKVDLRGNLIKLGYSLLILSFIFSSFWIFRRYGNEKHLFRAIHARSKSNWPQLEYEIKKSYNKSVLALDPTGTPLNWYLGTAIFNQGRYSESMKYYKKAEQNNPFHINVLNDIGGVYSRQKYFKEAKKYYEKALKTTPLFGSARLNLAISNYNLKKYEDAYQVIIKGNITHYLSGEGSLFPTEVICAIFEKKIRLLINTEQDLNVKNKLNSVLNSNKNIVNLYNKCVQENKHILEAI